MSNMQQDAFLFNNNHMSWISANHRTREGSPGAISAFYWAQALFICLYNIGNICLDNTCQSGQLRQCSSKEMRKRNMCLSDPGRGGLA